MSEGRAGEGAGEGATMEAWDLPLDQAPLAFVDLEMTGLDPKKDRVCEVCIIRCQGGREIETLESLVDPGTGPGASAAIHGLLAEALAGAPTFEALSVEIARLLDGALLVAHAAQHDVGFLEAELSRSGKALTIAGVIDTLVLSRRSFALPSHRLGALAESLGLSHPRAHRAGDDARATRDLFWKAVEVLAPATARDLSEVKIGERHARPEIVARAEEAVAEGGPVLVRYRPARRGPEEITMVLTAVLRDMDPPRVLGYGLPGRGRKELRADRILAILPAAPGKPR